MGDLLEDYDATGSWDEMLDPAGSPRVPYRVLHDALRRLSSEELDERCLARDRSFRDQGITFSIAGSIAGAIAGSIPGEERPFPLDLVPRVLAAKEWATVEAGVVQRVQALEAFLADVYGPGEILRAGVVPHRLVFSSRHFHRSVLGIDPANGVRVHVAGIDLARDGEGRFCVLEDNVRIPSGISYVVENRRSMARVFPELFASHRVRPVDSYPARLLEALQAAAPAGAGEPNVVVLTPGVHNAAYFEHTFLARRMGVELVEGRDLLCRGTEVFMRTTEGEQRVDVVYRRVDDDYLDALHFRGTSILGCPGIVNAARAGKVTIANAVGNGVADDKLVYTYVPAMIDFYLGQSPLLPNVTTYRLDDQDQLDHVLGRLDQLVVKPVDGSGGHGLVMGPQAGDEELAQLRLALLADPRGWIVQELVSLSTSPTHIGERLSPRHVDLRPFAVNDGTRIWVVPGGLTRVALPAGCMVVNSSQGGGSKDTWVLAAPGARGAEPTPAGARPPAPLPQPLPFEPAPPDPGPAFAQAAQQQQWGQPAC